MTYRTMLTLCVLLVTGQAVRAQEQEGKQIFKTQCTSCHSVHAQVVGPALGGIETRRDIDWIVHFVRSSQTVIKGGDPYANALFEKFNRMVMPDHPDLTDAQIKSIVDYIIAENKNAPVVKLPFPRPHTRAPAYLPITFQDYGYVIAYLALLGLLVFVLYIFVRIQEIQRKGSSQA